MIHVYQRLIRVEILLVLNKFKTNALLIVSIYFKSYKYIYIIYIIYIYIYICTKYKIYIKIPKDQFRDPNNTLKTE